MSDENKPCDTPPQPDQPTPPGPEKKRKLTLDIDEVDVSEVLERKISA